MGKYHVHQTDKAEPMIVEAMVKSGATVQKLGRPVDLIVAYRGQTALVECKNPKKEKRSSAKQQAFLRTWPGVWRVLTTPEGGIELVEHLKWLAGIISQSGANNAE